MIGDGEGEIARLVRRYRCGIVIAPGDAVMLADTLRCWANGPRIASEMGARARQMLDAQFNRRRALDQRTRLIDRVDPARSHDTDTCR
jgi:glycosyltransferase involved in cell wall biosynthesis